jgi:hypothetical protein
MHHAKSSSMAGPHACSSRPIVRKRSWATARRVKLVKAVLASTHAASVMQKMVWAAAGTATLNATLYEFAIASSKLSLRDTKNSCTTPDVRHLRIHALKSHSSPSCGDVTVRPLREWPEKTFTVSIRVIYTSKHSIASPEIHIYDATLDFDRQTSHFPTPFTPVTSSPFTYGRASFHARHNHVVPTQVASAAIPSLQRDMLPFARKKGTRSGNTPTHPPPPPPHTHTHTHTHTHRHTHARTHRHTHRHTHTHTHTHTPHTHTHTHTHTSAHTHACTANWVQIDTADKPETDVSGTCHVCI